MHLTDLAFIKKKQLLQVYHEKSILSAVVSDLCFGGADSCLGPKTEYPTETMRFFLVVLRKHGDNTSNQARSGFVYTFSIHRLLLLLTFNVIKSEILALHKSYIYIYTHVNN
jgi:hypothetical protein